MPGRPEKSYRRPGSERITVFRGRVNLDPERPDNEQPAAVVIEKYDDTGLTPNTPYEVVVDNN